MTELKFSSRSLQGKQRDWGPILILTRRCLEGWFYLSIPIGTDH
jgi:hypothetical protein